MFYRPFPYFWTGWEAFPAKVRSGFASGNASISAREKNLEAGNQPARPKVSSNDDLLIAPT
jgi:hypothetical protein